MRPTGSCYYGSIEMSCGSVFAQSDCNLVLAGAAIRSGKGRRWNDFAISGLSVYLAQSDGAQDQARYGENGR